MQRDKSTTGFAFVHQDIINHILRHLKPQYVKLYLALMSFYPNIKPSTNRLADLTGYDQRRVRTLLAELESIGILKRIERVGRANEYDMPLSRFNAQQPIPQELIGQVLNGLGCNGNGPDRASRQLEPAQTLSTAVVENGTVEPGPVTGETSLPQGINPAGVGGSGQPGGRMNGSSEREEASERGERSRKQEPAASRSPLPDAHSAGANGVGEYMASVSGTHNHAFTYSEIHIHDAVTDSQGSTASDNPSEVTGSVPTQKSACSSEIESRLRAVYDKQEEAGVLQAEHQAMLDDQPAVNDLDVYQTVATGDLVYVSNADRSPAARGLPNIKPEFACGHCAATGSEAFKMLSLCNLKGKNITVACAYAINRGFSDQQLWHVIQYAVCKAKHKENPAPLILRILKEDSPWKYTQPIHLQLLYPSAADEIRSAFESMVYCNDPKPDLGAKMCKKLVDECMPLILAVRAGNIIDDLNSLDPGVIHSLYDYVLECISEFYAGRNLERHTCGPKAPVMP
jgi:hypothetical protein